MHYVIMRSLNFFDGSCHRNIQKKTFVQYANLSGGNALCPLSRDKIRGLFSDAHISKECRENYLHSLFIVRAGWLWVEVASQ